MNEYQKDQYGLSGNVLVPDETELGVDFDALGEEQDISELVARNVNTLVREANANMNRTKAQVANHFGVADPGNIAWCAWFVRMCGNSAGINFGSSNVANNITTPFGRFNFVQGAAGTTNNKPRVGDILYIQPTGSSGVSHVGIVDSVNTSGNITAIEGNMSGQSSNWNNTSTVRRGSYNYNTGDGGSWGRIIDFGATTRI